MKKINTLLLIFISFCTHAQIIPVFEWAAGACESTNTIRTNGMVRDASGNLLVCGYYTGTADLDPSVSVFNVTSAGSNDIFIAKVDVVGNFLWAKSIGNTGDDQGNSLAVDASGNIYIGGFFENMVDFDPGIGTFNLTSNGSLDAFVIKLDANGDLLWAKSFGSTPSEEIKAIKTHPLGGVCFTGTFTGTVDFDPGVAVFSLTGTGDIFVERLTDAGDFIWAVKFGGPNSDRVNGLAVDNSGNVHTTGSFSGTADFDPGVPVSNLTVGIFPTDDLFVSKLDANGNFIWARQTLRTTASPGLAYQPLSISVDASGNVVSTGAFIGSQDFDPGAGTLTLTASSEDTFISKLDASGTLVWAKKFTGSGSISDNHANSTAFDAGGNVYLTGGFENLVTFDPAGSLTFAINVSVPTTFIVKLSAAGNISWARAVGGGSGSTLLFKSFVELDAMDNIYVAGPYRGTRDFDPASCSTFNLSANTASSSNSLFFTKLSQQAVHTISSFTPTSGPAGTPVTITGTDFSSIAANNDVRFFNNQIATVSASTSTSINTAVPASATTGRISVTRNCITVQSATDFVVGVVLLPTITNFTPSSGLVGTSVVITGANFSPTPGENDVQFNGTTAVVTASSTTFITTTVPPGATTGPITVTVAGESDTSTNDFTVTTASITITTQPISATVCDGTIVTFTTAATGTTNITYQWQIRDSDGGWEDVIDGGGYSGATTPMLTVNTSGTFGEESYQCLVSGDFASDEESDEVFLDIAPNAPSIADVVNCGPGAVTVTASGGTNGQYRWYTQASGGTAIPGEVNSTFTTPVLTSTTIYYVSITNGVCEGPRSDVQVAISTCQPQPGFVWGQGMGVGTMANGINGGNTILIDGDGNLLVCGGFQGTIDFDNGSATVNLTASNTDSFLLKMTPDGTLLWAKGIGGTGSGSDGVSGMSIDGAGNIYMLFAFNGTSDFDPGPGITSLTSTPSSPANKSDLAVAKYDRDGNFIWVRQIAGASDEYAGGLKADAAGNVYVTGGFRQIATGTSFGGTFTLTALGTNSTDAFITKLNSSGTFLWAGSIGSPLATAANLLSDQGVAIDIDGTGNVYVSGRVYGPSTTIDFDPGTGTVPQAIIDQAGFVLKLDNSGVYQNHYIVEGAAGNAVSVDASGNIYFTGAFTGTVDIDPGPSVFDVTGDGANYITKLNSSGNFVWGKMLNPGGFGVNPSVLIRGIVFDGAGDLLVTGYNTAGATDFDLGPLVEPRGLNGLFVLNPFVWKLNSDGDFNWVINMRRISGSFATASIASVAVSTTGDIFTTGNYARHVDLDPGLCQFAVTNVNGQDIFISRLSPAQPNVCFAQQPSSVSACDNDIVTFTTGIVDSGSIFYQWQKLNTSTSQFENITNTGGYSGTTASSLTVNTAGNFGAGEYRCKVSGNSTVGEFSNPATLSFVTTVALVTTGATGCPGSALTLTASGGNDGEYRWYTDATGGTAISGEMNGTFVTPALTATSTYYVSIAAGICESTRVAVTATIGGPTCPGPSNQPPVIASATLIAGVEGSATFDLLPLISDPDGNLDPSSLSIVQQPISGAPATIASGVLTIDYNGVSFSGTDLLTIEVCDLSGSCVQQQINIEVVGDIIVYTGISPNGDGLNDTWIIRYIEAIAETQDNVVSIYNRWGDLVYETENYNNSSNVFTGVSKNGNELSSGIYFYKIEFKGGRTSQTGYINVKR